MTNNTQLVQWFFRVLTAGMHADPKIGLDLLLVQSVINQSIYLTVATIGIARRVPCTLLAFKSLDATGTESPTTTALEEFEVTTFKTECLEAGTSKAIFKGPIFSESVSLIPTRTDSKCFFENRPFNELLNMETAKLQTFK